MGSNETETATILSDKTICVLLPMRTTLLFGIYLTVSWVFAAVASIISPTVVLLNALIIIVVKRRKELHRASNVLLSSIAFTDYLGGSLWAKYLNVV